MGVYEDITQKIVSAIEAGQAKGDAWKMPWHSMSSRPENILTGKEYQGVNTLNLWIESQARGFSSSKWATFKQWGEVGAKVKKGEKGSLVVFWKPIVKASDGDQEDDKKFVLKTFVVFNQAQVEGYYPPLEFVRPTERLDEVDMFIEHMPGLIVQHGGDRAFYHTKRDYIQMPPREDFYYAHGYYSTLLHECAHWTGHESRLNREFGKRFGDVAYAFEELVAELSAAFLCADLGVSNQPRHDHAEYVASWLKVLKNDSRAIFTAATAAQKAVGFLSSFNEVKEKAA